MSDGRPEGSRSQSRNQSRNQSQQARPAVNVKPKPSQKEVGHSQSQWKKEKPPKARRSRSSDLERGRRREAEGQRGERRRRGRSEESRRQDGGAGGTARGNAGSPQDDVEDTECAVCFCAYDNVFKTPKLLACGHTFCLECLARINVTSAELKTLSCPICREVTRLPHGQDLPRLGNNRVIIGKLPPEMHRALSIRFKRSEGKLFLRNPPAATAAGKPSSLTLPVKSREEPGVSPEGNPSAMEQGIAPATMVDVGRPPSRIRGRMRRVFRSDQCYYAVVGSIITVTVLLMLVGLLAFVVIPRVTAAQGSTHESNHTSGGEPNPELRP